LQPSSLPSCNNEHFITKIADLVSQKLAASGASTNWFQLTQSGRGSKRKLLEDPNEHFITKIAHLVSQKLSPDSIQTTARPVSTNWLNYDLSPPSTSVMGNVNTTPGTNV
jgi:hypothetical protein